MNDRQTGTVPWLLGLLILLLAATAAQAHRLRPAIVTATFDAAGTYEISIVLNAEAVLAGIGPEHEDTNESPRAEIYDGLRALPAEALQREFDASRETYLAGIVLQFDSQRVVPQWVGTDIPEVGDLSVERLTTVRLSGPVPAGAKSFTWSYAAQFGESALRIGTGSEGIVRSEWLAPGKASAPFPLAPWSAEARSWTVVFGDYLVLGFTHILPKGLDHILFVLGIFLLSLKWRPLLYQVTAFTVAHSITLALSLYGLVSLSPSIVEPLIALSIVYVAVENLLTRDLQPWRVYVVFGFGLLHGMGFAGVLTELGLPEAEFVTALVAFNVGVELGQLAVIFLAFVLVAMWFRHSAWYRKLVVVPGSVLIALIGAWWTIERVFGFGAQV